MKTNSLLKGMLVVVLFLSTMFTASAKNSSLSDKITNNVMDEFNNVTSTIIYNKDNNTLIPEFRFNFKYDSMKRVVEKTTQKWVDNKWVNCFMVDITYNDVNANLKYSVWNKSTNKFEVTSVYDCELNDIEESIK